MLDFNLKDIRSEEHLVGSVLSESSLELTNFLLMEKQDKDAQKVNFITRSLKAIQEKFFNKEFKLVLESKGNVKAVQGYASIVKAISIMDKELKDSEGRKDLIEVKKALAGLEKYSKDFKELFDKNDIILSLYATTLSSVIALTSSLASGSFEYDVTSQGTKIKSVRNKVNSNITLDNVKHFNKMVSDGTLNKLFSQVRNEINAGGTVNNFLGINADKAGEFISNNFDKAAKFSKTVADKVTSTGVGLNTGKIAKVVAISAVSIFVIREAVYYFYYFRNSVSAYLENLASFVELNASKNKNMSQTAREKQVQLAERIYVFADKINAYNVTIERKIKDEIKKEESQAKSDPVGNSINGDILL